MTKKLNKWQKELIKLSATDESKVAKSLQRAYESVLKDVRKEVRHWLDTYDYENLPEYRRSQIANLVAIDTEITKLIKESGLDIAPIIDDYRELTYKRGYYSTFYSIEQYGGVRVDFMGVDSSLLRNSLSSPVDGMTLVERLERNHVKLSEKAINTLRNGVALGKSYSQIAREISDQGQASYRQAMTIVRTDGGRLRSEGRMQSRQEAVDMGIELKKRWVSTLDGKTRGTHRALDGQVVEPDEEFTSHSGNKALEPHMFGVPSEDINCRCDTVTDIEGIPPTVRRDGMTDEIIPYQTYEEWERARVNND